MNSLKKNREKFLPFVKDWTNPQNHIRYEKNTNKLSYNEWFWCHPSAYKLIYYSISIFAIISYFISTAYFFIKNQILLATLFLIILILVTFQFKKKIDIYPLIKEKTFYDQYLRDY